MFTCAKYQNILGSVVPGGRWQAPNNQGGITAWVLEELMMMA